MPKKLTEETRDGTKVPVYREILVLTWPSSVMGMSFGILFLNLAAALQAVIAPF